MLGQKRNEFRRQLDKLAKQVAALRDHFSLFGLISDIEIEELGEGHCQNAPNDFEVMRNCSAWVSFATRHSAKRVFVNGKSWHGHNLHFLWATPSIPCCSRTSGESFSPLKSALHADIQSADKTAQTNSLKASGDPTESVSSCAQPLNEVSCDSSRSGDGGTTPLMVENIQFLKQSLLISQLYPPRRR